MAGDMGVARDSEFRGKNRENGANPLRSRRCNGGRKPQLTTAKLTPTIVAGIDIAGRCGR
jgi:hypothetical protein